VDWGNVEELALAKGINYDPEPFFTVFNGTHG
jgi:hypothetical protein